MKQINIRLGKRDEPLKIRKINMQKKFKMFDEIFVVTDFAGCSNINLTDFIDGLDIKYTVTHYKTGASVIHSLPNEEINALIDRAKKFLTGRKNELKNQIKNLEVINEINISNNSNS